MNTVNFEKSRKLAKRVNKILPKRLRSKDRTCGFQAAIGHCLLKGSTFVTGAVIDRGEVDLHAWIEHEKHGIIDPAMACLKKKDFKLLHHFPQVVEDVWHGNACNLSPKQVYKLISKKKHHAITLHAESLKATLIEVIEHAKNNSLVVDMTPLIENDVNNEDLYTAPMGGVEYFVRQCEKKRKRNK